MIRLFVWIQKLLRQPVMVFYVDHDNIAINGCGSTKLISNALYALIDLMRRECIEGKEATLHDSIVELVDHVFEPEAK